MYLHKNIPIELLEKKIIFIKLLFLDRVYRMTFFNLLKCIIEFENIHVFFSLRLDSFKGMKHMHEIRDSYQNHHHTFLYQFLFLT